MDAPSVPRSRKPKHTLRNTLTSFVKPQYPHVNARNGRRELKAQTGDRAFPNGYSIQQIVPSSLKDRPMARTAEPSSSSSEEQETHEPLVEDFQDRYTPRSVYSPTVVPRTTTSRATPRPHSVGPLDSPDFSDFEDATAANRQIPKPDVYVPTRTDSDGKRQSSSTRHSVSRKQSSASVASERVHLGRGDRSSTADSIYSHDTSATSVHPLPPLQTKGPDNGDAHLLAPVLEDDPRSFDLVAPPPEELNVGMYAMERRAEQMFSRQHLRTIFDDPKLLLRFTGFLNVHRAQSIPLLIYYLDALKALRAISYANAIAEALDPIRGLHFTDEAPDTTANAVLEAKANQAFEVLVREDLPAYIAWTWTRVVSVSIQRRITGTLALHLREASEGLAEVFCLTDPSRPDNPIVFASEEFARTTQYGMSYTIGRNCRFLQGPKTNPHSVRRMAEACQAGKEHTEVFVNYRRDGSPFMNLLMIAPLMDSRGSIRYYIGAQVDVSGLVKDCSELDGLARMVEREEDAKAGALEDDDNGKDEFQELSEMLNGVELEIVRKYGGRMHKEYVDDSDVDSIASHGR